MSFWVKVKTFLFLQWNARKIAVALDNNMRALGHKMDHTGQHRATCRKCKHDMNLECTPGSMLMTVETRAQLIREGNNSLPWGWRWRED